MCKFIADLNLDLNLNLLMKLNMQSDDAEWEAAESGKAFASFGSVNLKN